MTRRADLNGRRFGRFVVVDRIYGRTQYARCQCDCGAVKQVFVSNLVRGLTRSCGCLSREIARITMAKMPRKLPTLDGFIRAVSASYRASSKRRPVEIMFALSFTTCKKLFTGRCYYCGTPPSNRFSTSNGTYDSFRYSGIDRLNSNKGYIPGNCVPCCIACNLAKQGMTKRQFIAWVTRVYTHCVLRKPQKRKHAFSSPPCQRGKPR